MGETNLELNLVPGKVAPRYPKEVCDRKLTLDKVVITEQGTESNLPIVDFQCSDPEGRQYYFAITGRLCNMISAAVKGVNSRIHGQEEP